jgi:hypothetical protein
LSGCLRSPGHGRQQRRDPGGPLPDDRGLAKRHPRCLDEAVASGQLVRGAGELPERPATQVVDLRDEHGARRCEVPAECRRPLHQRAAIRDMAGHELFEAHRLEPPVGLGDRAPLDEPKGRDRGRVIERLELVVAKVSRLPQRDDRAVPFGAHADRLKNDGAPAQGRGAVEVRRSPGEDVLVESR